MSKMTVIATIVTRVIEMLTKLPSKDFSAGNSIKLNLTFIITDEGVQERKED